MHILHNDEPLRLWKTYDMNIPYAGFARLGRDWKEDKVCSPFSRIYYTVHGEGMIHLPDRDIPLSEGKVYLIPAGLFFSYDCENYMEQLFFHVNLTHRNGIDLFRNCKQIYVRDASPQEMESILMLYQSKNIADAFCLKSVLFEELANFMAMAGLGEVQSGSYSPLVEQMFQLAQNPVSAGHHINELAEKLHVSTSTLSKRFRQETGMSPREYLEQLVISRACTLLLADELSIADVAEELGFSDQFYFAKYFKKQMHVSPSGYRRQMKMTGKGD